ncbi:hypothetical protein R1flu_020959 [Riccia fluitans]|uniref:FHA domain-containing protein n=1 Tax=Riccia fluitans TaxID=41844 RepID=A0ABD1ZN05_9MARC
MKALIFQSSAAVAFKTRQQQKSAVHIGGGAAAAREAFVGRNVCVVVVPQERHQDELKNGKGSVSWRLRWRVQPPRHQAHQGSGWRVFASAQIQTVKRDVKWFLDSVGDGDCSHLDAKVPLPGSFELVSDSAIVGRAGGKADILLDVATVSSMHARLEKREQSLFITDLDSTNGTYVDGRRIRPGAVTPVSSGSIIVFGDEHLAVFRVAVEETDDKDEGEPQAAAASNEAASSSD